MTMTLFVDGDYIDSVASNGGWRDFTAWAPDMGAIGQLANTGVGDVSELKIELAANRDQITAQHLHDLLAPLADGEVLVSDGLGDIDDGTPDE